MFAKRTRTQRPARNEKANVSVSWGVASGMTKLKVHILGNGNAAGKHRKAYAELPELYEVIDDEYAADIIDICTPPQYHSDEIKAAMDSRKRVFCEKPIAGSLIEVDELIANERFLGSRVCPIFQYRFTNHLPMSLWLSRDRAYFSQSKWRGTWETEFGGCLTSQGIHLLDRVSECFEPESVENTLFVFDPRYNIETETQMNVTFYGQNWKCDIFVMLSEPSAFDDLGDPVHENRFPDSHPGYVTQFRLAHEAFTTGGPLPVTLEDARKSIELLTACYYSAYTGKPVKLPILPSHPFYNGWQTAMKQWSQQRLQHMESSRKTHA